MVFPDVFAPSTVSWPAFLLGFLSFAITLGPLSTTSIGKRFGVWFGEIGIAGRTVVIFLVILTVQTVVRVELLSRSFLSDIASGGLTATFIYFIAHLVWAGTVSGWLPEQNGAE